MLRQAVPGGSRCCPGDPAQRERAGAAPLGPRRLPGAHNQSGCAETRPAVKGSAGARPRGYRVSRVPSSRTLPRPGLPSWLPRDCREPRELCGDRLRCRGPSAGPPLGQPPGM